MASSLPGSGSLSAGTKAGAERSVNLFKNDVVTPTSFNSKFSLKASSDTLAAAKANGLALPKMVVGPPYKFSELYGAGTVRYEQIIGWTVTVDGSDFYKWSPETRGVLIKDVSTLLEVQHTRGQKATKGIVTDVYSFFSNKPEKILVQVYASQGKPKINDVEILSSGNNSNKTVDVYINISPDSNGSFTYTIGDIGWGAGTTRVVLLAQPETSTLLVTHRNFQPPGKASITSTLFLNGAFVAVNGTITKTGLGTTTLPFSIIEATKASIMWEGRDDVEITEYPTASNGYSTTVLINDDSTIKSGSYAVRLTLRT